MKAKTRILTGSTSQEVTKREVENRKLARRAAAESFVLLKNEDQILPIAKGAKLGLYGAGAGKTIKGGTGSGDVNERDCVSIYQGLKENGYTITSEEWIQSYDDLYNQARQNWKAEIIHKAGVDVGDTLHFFETYSTTPFIVPCGNAVDIVKAKTDGADTAVFVLSRIAGENADRNDVKGDYYITDDEYAILKQVAEAYENIIMIINTGGLIDLEFTESLPAIKGIIQFMQAGQEGGNALADILSGEVTPCGKMTDSWANSYKEYPNAYTFSHKNGNVNSEKYEEGIFVGYRYFDTFEIPVRYSFGYGLSYTGFELSAGTMKAINNRIQMTVHVKNVGDQYSGKEVAQIYVSCPQTGLIKEHRRLAAFAKTKKLAPKEQQEMKISFPIYQLASYSEERAAWMLEKGVYGLWLGNSLTNAKLVGSISVDADVIMTQCEHICPLKETLNEITPDIEMVKRREANLNAQCAALPQVNVCGCDITSRKVEYTGVADQLTGYAGEVVNSLSKEQLVLMATGDPGKSQNADGNALGSAGLSVPGSAAETSWSASGEPWNIPAIVLADGPAGLRLNQTYQVVEGEIVKENFLKSIEGGFFAPETDKKGTTHYQFCTAIPVGTLLAQSWDVELLKEIGEMIGHEMELFNVTLWLAPGMNIHRNPLCGRNFEYYSEDPLLSGIMASAITLGVQKIPGVGTTIKHFACNNQEDNRMGSDSVISERALREIYLKGFEIAVINSQPMSIMTSYNQINGEHAANCYDICTKAARDEWGFKGAIMTDWTTTTGSTAGICTAAGCVRAGNDMVMPGTPQDHKNIRQELTAGNLDIKTLKWCIWNTVRICLQSNQFEDAVSYLAQFKGLNSWIKVE